MSYLGQGLGLGREERFTATATAGQTTVSVGDDGRSISYTPNYVDVYLNGVKMVNGSDVTVTSGTAIVFASALAAGDSVDVVAPGYFQPADTVSRSLGGTFLGPVNLPSGGLNVGSGQLKVDSSGRVTMSSQPGFAAYSSGGETNFTGTNDLLTAFNATKHNTGSHFNTATCRFTAPIAGKYLFTASVWKNINTAEQASFGLFLNGSQYEECRSPTPSDGRYIKVVLTCIVNMAVNDYVELRTTTFNQRTMIASDQYNKYCGQLLG